MGEWTGEGEERGRERGEKGGEGEERGREREREGRGGRGREERYCVSWSTACDDARIRVWKIPSRGGGGTEQEPEFFLIGKR